MPETIVRPSHSNPRALTLERASFYDAGVDNFTKPPAQNPDAFETLENVEPIVDNRLNRRRGYTLFSNPLVVPRRIFEAHFTSGANRLILAAADASGTSVIDNRITSVDESGTRGHATNNILTPAASATQPSIAVSRQYAYICDSISGDLKKWDGADNPATAGSVTDWGINAVTSATPTAADNGAGNITTLTYRYYAVAFLNTVTKHAVLTTDSAGAVRYTTSIEKLTAKQVLISSVPTFDVTGTGYVTADFNRIILATADGGPTDTLYEVGRITNNTGTTFTDNISEPILLASEVWAQLDASGQEIGIYNNDRLAVTAPTLSLVIPHQGRLYGMIEQFLYWSKNLSEVTTTTSTVAGRFEECWPANYQMSIAVKEEFGRALLSDGVNLYIGTDRGIRVLGGDYPYFNGPRTLFREVGVMRQDVWSAIYHAGQQVGAIWLTPDRRVIASDFNTYDDIGRPIQDLLNDINISRARLVSNAIFVSEGPYEMYLLAVPAPGAGSPIENDVLCVYSLTTRHWVTWKPLDPVHSQAFLQDITNNRALWVFGSKVSTTGKAYRWFVGSELDTAANFNDRVGDAGSATYAATIKTGWLDWGIGQVTKLLEDIEVLTGDSALTITIEGASTEAQFTTPVTVLAATAVSAHPFGQYKIGLSGKYAKYRFYRFTFTSPAATTRDVLNYFAVEALPAHRF